MPRLGLGRLQRPQTATPGARPRTPSTSTFWIFSVGAATLVLMGWLLPWFVQPTASGVGYSPMDVVASNPTGFGTVLVYVLAVTMVIVLASPALELYYRVAKRPVPPILDRARLVVAVVGIALTLIVVLLTRFIQEEPLFGRITSKTITDSAVWLTVLGYIMAGLAYGARRWVVRRSTLAAIVVGLPAGILLPLMFYQAPNFIVWAASALAIYTLLALGLNVVVGFAGLLDLGYAAFFAIGAYTCASLASPKHSIHLPLWVLIFLGAAVASMFGALLGAPTLRLRGDYLAIVTLGFGEIIPDLATNNVGKLTGGPDGISSIDQPVLFGIHFGIDKQWYYWSLLVVVIIVVILLRNLERSRVGRAWVALREDEVAAAATGINTTSTKLLAFAIGASISGLAGAFYGSLVTIVSPDDFSFQVSVSILAIVVLGGIGNIIGVIVGSFVLTFVIFWVLQNLNEWSATVGNTINVPALGNIDYSKITYIIYGVALIAMMLLRPGGLIPSRARQIELQSGGEEESLAAVHGRA